MPSFLKQGRSEGGQWEEGKEAEGGGGPGAEGGRRRKGLLKCYMTGWYGTREHFHPHQEISDPHETSL